MWHLVSRQLILFILSGSWLIRLLTITLPEPKFKFLKLLGKVMDLDRFGSFCACSMAWFFSRMKNSSMILSFLPFGTRCRVCALLLFAFPCKISASSCRYCLPKSLISHSRSFLTSLKLCLSRLKRGALPAPHTNNVTPGFPSFLSVLQGRYFLLLFIVIDFLECLTTSISFSPLHRHGVLFWIRKPSRESSLIQKPFKEGPYILTSVTLAKGNTGNFKEEVPI